MWKRTTKNIYGKVDRVYKSGQYLPEDPVYDALPEVKYTVEYLPVKHVEAAEKANLCGSDIDPWELRDSFETDSLGLFMQEIMVRLLDPTTEDIFPFMEVGEKETCMEIPGTIQHSLRSMINADLNRKQDALEKQIAELSKELANATDFIKSVHATDMYREWKDKENRY